MGGERLLMKNHLWKGSKEQRHGSSYTQKCSALNGHATRRKGCDIHMSVQPASALRTRTPPTTSKLMFVHKIFTFKMSQLENLQTQEVLL